MKKKGKKKTGPVSWLVMMGAMVLLVHLVVGICSRMMARL